MSRRASDYDDEPTPGWLHPSCTSRVFAPPSGWRPDLVPAARLALWYGSRRWGATYTLLWEELDRTVRARGSGTEIEDLQTGWKVIAEVPGGPGPWHLVVAFFCRDDETGEWIEVHRTKVEPTS